MADLRELGVVSLGDRKRLLKAAAQAPAGPGGPAEPGPGVAPATPSCTLDDEGERRHATVMFSDLTGYTALNEAFDPEEVEALMAGGWITHLGTNGAGSIHDWEFAFQNWSTQSVEQNVATGTFGTWDETSRSIHLALLAGGLRGEGYGISLGRFINDDGMTLPTTAELEKWQRNHRNRHLDQRL